jgi:opacity protein-like surface antigen
MIRRVALLLSLIVILAAVAAEAQPTSSTLGRRQMGRAGQWDFSLQTRYTASQNYANDNGSALWLKDDLGLGFGFGYHLDERFNLGMAFTWRSIRYDATAVDPDDGSLHGYNGTMDTGTVAIAGDWNLLPGRFTPYVSGSLGWMLIDTNIVAGIGSGCWYDPWLGYVCGSYVSTYGVDSGFASLGAGVRWQMAESVFMRVGYDHGWLDAGPVDDTNMLRIDIGLMN